MSDKTFVLPPSRLTDVISKPAPPTVISQVRSQQQPWNVPLPWKGPPPPTVVYGREVGLLGFGAKSPVGAFLISRCISKCKKALFKQECVIALLSAAGTRCAFLGGGEFFSRTTVAQNCKSCPEIMFSWGRGLVHGQTENWKDTSRRARTWVAPWQGRLKTQEDDPMQIFLSHSDVWSTNSIVRRKRVEYDVTWPSGIISAVLCLGICCTQTGDHAETAHLRPRTKATKLHLYKSFLLHKKKCLVFLWSKANFSLLWKRPLVRTIYECKKEKCHVHPAE